MTSELKSFFRYLPQGGDDVRRGLYVLAGGWTLIPARTPYPPTQHPADHHFVWQRGRTLSEYQIVYITRGSGVFESDCSPTVRLRAGNVFILFPSVWHRYSPDPRTGWDEYYVAFNGSSAASLVAEHGFSAAKPVLDTGVDDAILSPFLRIAEEIEAESIGYQHLLSAWAVQIMAQVHVAIRRKSLRGQHITHMMERAKILLEERIKEPVTASTLANELHVSYSWFRSIFKRYTGMAPAKYHLQLRLNSARERLKNSSLPVGEIALQLGFESAPYFSRIFKQKTGLTPKSFRRQHQGG